MAEPLCVDIHLHIGTSRDGAALTWEEIRVFFEKGLMTHAVLFPIDETDPGPSYSRLNDGVAAIAGRDPRVIGFCRLNPHEPEAALRELKRCRGLGLRGVKLHPRTENFAPHDVEDLIAEIERERLPVMLHSSHEIHCHPHSWEGIFLRHPKISFILAHGGKDSYGSAAAVASQCPNVFLDTTTLSHWRTSYLLKELGVDKILYGSDAPYSHPALERLKFELILGAGSAAWRKVACENARRILGDLS